MAEVIGVVASGFTLAGLFKVFLDAIDLIQTAQNQDLDVKKLVLKLNIEKCRLYAWGEAVGLATAPVAGQPRVLETYPSHIQELVRDTLDMIVNLFTDTQKLEDRYGCKEFLATEAPDLASAHGNRFGPIDKLTTSFSRFKVINRPPDKFARLTLKTRWVVHDRKKFIDLVAEVRDFVNGLQDLTQSIYSTVQQESTFRRGVQWIDDVETLDLIVDVCEVDHPAIADAASERSTVISSAPLRVQEIEQWTSDVVPGLEDKLTELESLTVTELKHRVLIAARLNSHGGPREDLRSEIQDDYYKSGQQTAIIRILSFVIVFFLPLTFLRIILWMNTTPTSYSTYKRPLFKPYKKIWFMFEYAVPLCVAIMALTLWFRYETSRQRRRSERDSRLKQLQQNSTVHSEGA